MAIHEWERGSFSSDGVTHDVFRRGSGPGVIVVHEIPGITPRVLEFAEEVVSRGFTVAMPLLVGGVGKPPSGGYIARSMGKVCVSREFTAMATGTRSPVVDWLRALAKQLHGQVGGPGVGAVGMCFSGGFALGMMLDEVMVAPVLSQPSLPFAIGGKRSADLGLSATELEVVRKRAEAGCQVLGLRYTGDKLVGSRFDSLRALLGDAFVAIEFESTAKSDHSVLTEQRQDLGVQSVLEFFERRLKN